MWKRRPHILGSCRSFIAVAVRLWPALLVPAFLPSTANAGPTYFLVAEIPGREHNYDSYVLPLEDPADVAHARRLIAEGPGIGRPLIVASTTAGADGINGDYVLPDTRLWSWHISEFHSFADTTAEVLDGSPSVPENYFASGGGGNFAIGFWNYTVVAEMHNVPDPTTPAALAPLASALLCCRRRRA